ncbi:RHS repeat domain-containing protein [Klebsiella variicola]
MSSSSFYTAAGNFLSAIQGGVDPRTGLFTVNLPLADLRSNDLAGPGLKLALCYSPLNDRDDGFGRGFAMNLTRYDLLKRRLYLSTGESYPVSCSEGTALRHHNTLNFLMREQDGYISQVIHKSGLVEDLVLYNTAAYTRTLTDALGRSISFKWNRNSSGMGVRLSAVTGYQNGLITTLCSVKYSDDPEQAATFSVLPDDLVSGYDIVFHVRDGVLCSVSSRATDPEQTWSFGYDHLNSDAIKTPKPRYLVSMSSSAGLEERVTYPGGAGSSFPDGIGLPPLPRVSTHIISPGNDQAKTETQWEWTEENYLGRGVPGFDSSRWNSNSDYMLIRLAPDYTYGSTSVFANCRVTRRYNSFHQLVSEHTLRDGKEFIVRTDYYARRNATLNEQPRHYQLPMQQVKTWKVGNKSRTRETRWSYDDVGNLIKEWSPDGSITEYTWYPPEGEGDDCPAAMYGFRRYLKRKKVMPRRIQGDEVNTYTRYYWKKLSSLSGVKYGYVVLPDREVETTVLPTAEGNIERLKTQVSRMHYSDRQNPLTYGRESRRSTTHWPDKANSPNESYTRMQDFSYVISLEGFRQEESLTTHDYITLNRSNLRHPILGHLLSEKDALGVLTKYTWDKAGRMLTRTQAVGTKYERTFTRSYAIESTGLVTTDTDPQGNQMKTFYDGIGREVSRQQLDLDGPPDNDGNKEWYEVFSQSFNIFGEVEMTTHRDRVNLPDKPLELYQLNTTIDHDGFGNLSEHYTSDGVRVTDTIDPVALTRTVRSSGGNMTSATLTTELAPRLLLPQKETRSGDGVKAVRKYKWDGHHRLREMTDENGEITTYTWDDVGRLLTQTLENGEVVTRTWAKYLSSDLLTSIHVSGLDSEGYQRNWILGNQEFDGLGRLTLSDSGGRRLKYSYDGASPVPTSVRTMSGNTIIYTRTVPLDNVLTAVSATPGTGMQAAPVRQDFTRDSLTGNLLTATEGSTVTENILFPSGQLKKERFTSVANGVCEAGYARTLRGSVRYYTDPAGKTIDLVRDAFGRVNQMKDDAMTVDLKYDPLGRLSEYTTKDPATKALLTTTLEYDAFGREKTRTVTDRSANTVLQTLTWSPGGLLTGRIMRSGGLDVLTEVFTYDGRNRLTDYTANGSMLPTDGYDQEIKAQRYAFDALNNLFTVTTTLKDDSKDVATYNYDNIDDPTQLTSMEHTHAKYPKKITLSYDADGRVTQDETGKTLSYDAAGRLASVSGSPDSKYGYDALNRMVTQMMGDGDHRTLYYRGSEQVCEVKGLKEFTRLIKRGHTCFGMSDASGVTLTAVDRHNSLLLSMNTAQESGILPHVWSPYGGGKVAGGLPGFNGERPDPLTGNYHLGNGYRAWSPRLMRFTCPDSLSPFGPGGINPYAYCAGDPVNLTDPTGHISWQGWLGIGMGTLGLGATAIIAGMSISALGGLMAAMTTASPVAVISGVLGVVADGTAIASGALEDVNPQASGILGWMSMGTGMAGIGLIGAAAGLRRMTKTSNGMIYREMRIESPRVLGTENFQFNPNGPSQGIHVTYTAIDLDIGVPRLNIVAHGEPGRVLYHRETWLNADQLYQRLASEGVMSDRFHQIRMLSCYSADDPPGGISTAARLAQITGLPVEGYLGPMVMYEHLNIPFLPRGFDLRHYVNTAYIRGGEAEATALMHHYRAVTSIGADDPNNIPVTFLSLPGI